MHTVKVEWLGTRREDGTPTCLETEKVMPLGIFDIIPRDVILFEEPSPGSVKKTRALALRPGSLRAIKAALPRQYIMEDVMEGHQEIVASTPAPTSTVSHAGIKIGPNQVPRGVEEVAKWEATLEEIQGFEWSGKRKVTDPNPPSYRVANIRREGGGRMFGVVTSSHGDVQYDHAIKDLRHRIYRSKMAKWDHLPLMMRWQSLASANLTVPWDVVESNATVYESVKR